MVPQRSSRPVCRQMDPAATVFLKTRPLVGKLSIQEKRGDYQFSFLLVPDHPLFPPLEQSEHA